MTDDQEVGLDHEKLCFRTLRNETRTWNQFLYVNREKIYTMNDVNKGILHKFINTSLKKKKK